VLGVPQMLLCRDRFLYLRRDRSELPVTKEGNATNMLAASEVSQWPKKERGIEAAQES